MSQNLALSLAELTPRERIYVQNRLEGLTQVASAAAAGCPHPRVDGNKLEKKPRVQAAILAAMQQTAEEVGFTRREAHDMLLDAYRNAATAAEQIQAVKEMIALHGLAAPKQLEVKHNHDVSGTITMERMETADLVKLAGMENLALEGEFSEVKDDPTHQKLLR